MTDLQRVRSVREALRGLAATHNEGPESDGTEVLAEQARRSGLQVSFAADAAPILVGADGADGVLGTVLATDRRCDARRPLAAHEGVSQRALPLGLLRPLAQPHGHVVLDAHLRQPPQGARPSRPAGGRRMMTVLALAVARLRRRPGRGLLTALGVALAAAALVATLAIRTLAGDLALRQSITALPVGDRSATVSRSQATDDLPGLDRTARAALAPPRHGARAQPDHAARAVGRPGRRVPPRRRRGRAVRRPPDVGPAAAALQRRHLRGAADRPCRARPRSRAGHQDRRARGADRSRRAVGHVRPRAGDADPADVRPGRARRRTSP